MIYETGTLLPFGYKDKMTDKSKPLEDKFAEMVVNDRELRLASAEAIKMLNHVATYGIRPAKRKEALHVATRLYQALNDPELMEGAEGSPIPLIIHCPVCGVQHVDEGEWVTKPHRSHECQNCGHVWRVADVATVGVKEVQTKGQNDSGSVKETSGGTTLQGDLFPQHGDDFSFEVRDRVEKFTGAYKLEGIVVARFKTIDGEERYVIEHRPVAPGMLHIYGPANLRLLS